MTIQGYRLPRWLIVLGVAAAIAGVITMIVLPVMDVASGTREAGLGWSYTFLLIWRDLQLWLARLDWMTVFGAVLIVGTIVIFTKLSRSGSKFDFADAFAGENGKTSMSKMFMFMGGLAVIWGFVSLCLSGDMTEGYFGLFIAGVVLQKGITEGVGVLRQAQVARTIEARGGGPDPDPPPDTTVTRRPLGKRGQGASP